MPGLHAVLSPSSCSRWGVDSKGRVSCTPSARLEEKLKGVFGEKSSPFAAEGTKAHALGELKLRNLSGEYNDFTYKGIHEKLASSEPKITPAMERATDLYADIVMSKLYDAQRVSGDAKLLIEERYDLTAWVPECFGTGDAVIISDATLEVIDYKNGVGVKVDAVGNPQMRLYALGALAAYGDLYGFTHIKCTIVQPNIENVSEEILTREELIEWGEMLKPIADLAWKGQGEYKPGDHCRFCAAKALCAARAAEAMRGFTHGFATPGLIDDSEIPGILAVADVAEAWIKDVRAYARNQALRGQTWPGYKLVRGRKGNRVWTDEEQVREQLVRAGIPDEKYLKSGLKSPGDIEKAMGKQAFDALVKQYVTQPEGALNLVPEDDKRVEYASADADFSDLES